MYVVDFGKWDYRDLAEKPKERLTEFWTFYYEQFVRRQKKDAGEEGMVEIVDWDGFRLSNHASKDGESFGANANGFCMQGQNVGCIITYKMDFVSKFPIAIKLVMKMFGGLMRVNEFLKYGYLVNGKHQLVCHCYTKS